MGGNTGGNSWFGTPTYEHARRQAMTEKKQKKQRRVDKIAQREEVKIQKDKEIALDEVDAFTSPFSGELLVCNAETRADLEANMYERRKRVIFSQKMLKAMSLERTFWQNCWWKGGPRNGQVNGVSFNAESTETWEELQAAEDKLKGNTAVQGVVKR